MTHVQTKQALLKYTKRWLDQHSNDVPMKNPKEERRQVRIKLARRDRITKRNAAIRKSWSR